MGIIRNIVTKGLSFKVMLPSSSRAILAYHDVSNSGSAHFSEHYSTETKRFRDQIEFLQRNFEMVSLDEIVTKPKSGKRMLSVSFDDGFLSVKEEVSEYLTKKGIPFSVFINSTAVKENFLPYDLFPEIAVHHETQVFLNADDVKDLHRMGVTIGSHSSNHRCFSNCSAEDLKTEIGENKNYIESLLGIDVDHLAIPYGKKEHFNAAAVEFGKSVGHKYIYSTNPVYFSKPFGEGSVIPRIGVTNQTPDELCFLLNRPLVRKIDI
jgi:peptidoglycan/xylan/chitin deacetylase (PgdA/CDA1 family)